jgi:hypothetical protein
VEEFELLFAVVYRIGTNGFMSGESPILRPIPGHELELELDVITGLRTIEKGTILTVELIIIIFII